jgi:Ca2+-binding EF-hand superfamily protein
MTRFALVLALLAAMAAVPATAGAMEPYLPRTAKAFGKTDADANGKVTAAELKPFAEKRFARLDKDLNGAVSAAEIDQALMRVLERRRGRIMARLDADKDGVISRAEFEGFLEAMVTAADGDKDGGVSLDEALNYKVAKLRKPATGEKSN